MATWGGVGTWGIPGVTSNTMWLYMCRDVPRFSGLGTVLDNRHFGLYGVLQAMGTGITLDTALGANLDIVGSWLGLVRNGLTDDRYRRALRVRKTVTLTSGGTRASLLDVWSAWTGNAATEYFHTHPNEITIVGPVEILDQFLLAQFLTEAAPGARILNIYHANPTALRSDRAQALIGGTGTIDYAQGPAVAGAAELAARI